MKRLIVCRTLCQTLLACVLLSLQPLASASDKLREAVPMLAENASPAKAIRNTFSQNPLERASRKGRYSSLLAKVPCAPDRLDYGRYFTIGKYQSADPQYCGQKVPPAGFWVYVYPDWYIWGHENLAAVGLGMLERQVKLQQMQLKLEMVYTHAHKAWAQTSLHQAAEAILDLEHYTSRNFPGTNPYRIEEDPDLDTSELIGQANAHSMELAPPGDSSAWTVLHEVVHIWNVHSRDGWVREGLANTISWLLMVENGFAFSEEETLDFYLKQWQAVRQTRRDRPLPGNYERLPEGKAMAFWLMLYELYGPDFIRTAFVASLDKLNFGPKDLASLIQEETDREISTLFSGWLTPGPYKVRVASDFGPVKFQLPQ